MPSSRAGRAADMPRFASVEAASRRHYPKSMRVPGHDALLKYRVSRPMWVADEVDAISRTELFAWLMVGGRRVGALPGLRQGSRVAGCLPMP